MLVTRQRTGRCGSPGRHDPPGRAALSLGQQGLVTGDSVNDLLPFALDPNVYIQESKVATCDMRAGRAGRGVRR